MNKTYNGFDVLKFICCLIIIPIHICPLPFGSIAREFFRHIGNIGVPCFFMMGGFLFFIKYYQVNDAVKQKQLFIKSIKRLSVLLLIWLVPYFLLFEFWWITKGNILLNLLTYFKYILCGGPGMFLWYIVAQMIGLIICFYISKFPDFVGAIIAVVLLLIGALYVSYNFIWVNTYFGRIYSDTMNVYFRNGVFFAFPCMFSGMMLAKHEIPKMKKSIILFSVAVILFCVEFALLRNTGILVSTMMISSIFMAFALVMLFANIPIKKPYIVLRKLSFLVYVIHPIFINIIPKVLGILGGMDYYWYLWWPIQIPVIAVASIVVGLFLIKMSEKIPVLKKAM